MDIFSIKITNFLSNSDTVDYGELCKIFAKKAPITQDEIHIKLKWFLREKYDLDFHSSNVLNLIDSMYTVLPDLSIVTYISNMYFVTENKPFCLMEVSYPSSELSETEQKLYKIGCLIEDMRNSKDNLKELQDYLDKIKPDTKTSNKLKLMHSYATSLIEELEKE